MPNLTSLIEYGLYVDNLERAAEWYKHLFKFPTLMEEPGRLHALQAGPQAVLLLFQKGGSIQGVQMPTGFIPSHDGSGTVHLAFSMPREEVNTWATYLQQEGVDVESTIHWPEGGTSYYFRDPDLHLLELITPTQWKFTEWTASGQ